MTIYKRNEAGEFVPEGTTSSIPNSPVHRLYKKMMAEVAGGTSTIEPYVEPPEPNAETCTKLQMLEELADRDKEDALFAALNSSVPMMRRWNAASELKVSHPMVATMAGVLGYSAEEMQAVFNNASKRD